MDVREKLIEILKQAPFEGKVLDEWWLEEKIKAIADHLIANDITVQKWISVNDRLPIEEAKAHEHGWPGEYCEFLVMIEKGSLPTTLYYDLEENEWFRINTASERETYEVTHWMPLPEPPKGE